MLYPVIGECAGQFNPILEAEAGGFLISKSAWSTEGFRSARVTEKHSGGEGRKKTVVNE